MFGTRLHQDRADLSTSGSTCPWMSMSLSMDTPYSRMSRMSLKGSGQLGPMMTFVNVTIDQWNYLCGLGRLDGVGG
jgi:hypothetical protein